VRFGLSLFSLNSPFLLFMTILAMMWPQSRDNPGSFTVQPRGAFFLLRAGSSFPTRSLSFSNKCCGDLSVVRSTPKPRAYQPPFRAGFPDQHFESLGVFFLSSFLLARRLPPIRYKFHPAYLSLSQLKSDHRISRLSLSFPRSTLVSFIF